MMAKDVAFPRKGGMAMAVAGYGMTMRGGEMRGKTCQQGREKEHVREETDLPDSLKTDCVPYFLGHSGE